MAAEHGTYKPPYTPDLAKAAAENIAKRVLGISTLDTRDSDSLDFHQVAVWSVEAALREAYQAGRNFRQWADSLTDGEQR